MAEDKKGFVLYADLIETFGHLDLEQRGLLITWILDYVNDNHPDPLPGLMAAVCEPIKQQLKRDLVKYELRAEKSRLNGAKGGRPRKSEKPKKPTRLNNNLSEPKKPDTVTVTDTVSDTVTDNDISLNKESIEKYLISSFTWKESVIRTLKTKGFDQTLPEIDNLIICFCAELESTEDVYKNDRENKKHFTHWAVIQLKEINKNGKSTDTTKRSRFEKVADNNMETLKELGLDKESGG